MSLDAEAVKTSWKGRYHKGEEIIFQVHCETYYGQNMFLFFGLNHGYNSNLFGIDMKEGIQYQGDWNEVNAIPLHYTEDNWWVSNPIYFNAKSFYTYYVFFKFVKIYENDEGKHILEWEKGDNRYHNIQQSISYNVIVAEFGNTHPKEKIMRKTLTCQCDYYCYFIESCPSTKPLLNKPCMTEMIKQIPRECWNLIMQDIIDDRFLLLNFFQVSIGASNIVKYYYITNFSTQITMECDFYWPKLMFSYLRHLKKIAFTSRQFEFVGSRYLFSLGFDKLYSLFATCAALKKTSYSDLEVKTLWERKYIKSLTYYYGFDKSFFPNNNTNTNNNNNNNNYNSNNDENNNKMSSLFDDSIEYDRGMSAVGKICFLRYHYDEYMKNIENPFHLDVINYFIHLMGKQMLDYSNVKDEAFEFIIFLLRLGFLDDIASLLLEYSDKQKELEVIFSILVDFRASYFQCLTLNVCRVCNVFGHSQIQSILCAHSLLQLMIKQEDQKYQSEYSTLLKEMTIPLIDGFLYEFFMRNPYSLTDILARCERSYDIWYLLTFLIDNRNLFEREWEKRQTIKFPKTVLSLDYTQFFDKKFVLKLLSYDIAISSYLWYNSKDKDILLYLVESQKKGRTIFSKKVILRISKQLCWEDEALLTEVNTILYKEAQLLYPGEVCSKADYYFSSKFRLLLIRKELDEAEEYLKIGNKPSILFERFPGDIKTPLYILKLILKKGFLCLRGRTRLLSLLDNQ